MCIYIYFCYDFILTWQYCEYIGENIGDSGKVVMYSAVWRGPQQQRETE